MHTQRKGPNPWENMSLQGQNTLLSWGFPSCLHPLAGPESPRSQEGRLAYIPELRQDKGSVQVEVCVGGHCVWTRVVKWRLQCPKLLLEASKSLIGQEVSETLPPPAPLPLKPPHSPSSSLAYSSSVPLPLPPAPHTLSPALQPPPFKSLSLRTPPSSFNLLSFSIPLPPLHLLP